LRWAELEGREAALGRQRQQLSQQRPILRRGRGKHRRQLIQLRLGRVLALERGGARKLCDDRVEGAVLVVRRAEIAHAGIRFAPDTFLKGGGEAGLPDARLARKQHHAAFTTFRALPLAPQKVDLLLTSDKRRQHRPMQRLEPAFDGALAKHLIGVHRLRNAFRLDRAEIAALEQIAEQQPCLWPNHDRAGFCDTLQAGGEVRRLAHDAALLAFTGGDQVADDNLPGANADANSQRIGRLEPPDSVNESQAGPHRLLGVVLVRLRVAKVNQHPIAHVLGDKAVETGGRFGDAAMIDANDVA
jgi:hypothetical protein